MTDRYDSGRKSKSIARFTRLVGVGLGATLVFAACGTAYDDERIDYSYREVDIYEEAGLQASTRGPADGKGARVEDFEYTIYHVAQIVPVEVDGVTVQANDIVLSGTTAAIAYNTAGSAFAGAIQIVDISNPARPLVTAEIGFPGVDITTLAFDGDTLYFGGSIEPYRAEYTTEESDRSFVATLDLANLDAEGLEANTVNSATTFEPTTPTPDPHPYYYTTGIAVKDGTIYASVGADPGAVFLIDETGTASPIVEWHETTDVTDIRDIETYHGGLIAVAGTYAPNTEPDPEQGRVLLIADDGIDTGSTLPIADFGSDEAKATIEVYDNHYGFLGLSEAGFQVVFLRDEADSSGIVESIFTLDNPWVGWSTRTATNSASHSGDLVFTANGEAGFRVFRAEEKLLPNRSPPVDWLTLIGFVPFDETLQPSGDYWSANHVEFSGQSLFVASGLGGVAVYRLVAE